MDALLAGGRIMAIKASGMANIARLLFSDRLIAAERLVDLLNDLLGVFEGELVAFCPADRRGVCERRPSIIRAVDAVPHARGALPKVRGHNAGVELLQFLRMTVRLSAGLSCYGRIVAERDSVPVMPQQGADFIQGIAVRILRQHVSLAVITRRQELSNKTLSRYDIEIIVEHNKLQYALVRSGRIIGQAVTKVAIPAFGVRMARFLLHLLAGHHELRIAKLGHFLLIRVARNTPIA